MSTQKPRVKPESEYVYTNKFFEEELQFSPKPDEVMATFDPQTSEAEVMEVMEATSMAMSQGVNVQRGFAVFQVSGKHDTESASAALSDQSQVANTIPVMVDGEGLTRYFLPDEFTVQFEEGLSEDEIEQIISEKDAAVVLEQRTPGYYTLSVPDGKGLFETLREFNELDGVTFAEPSEVGFDDALIYIPADTEFPQLWSLQNTGQVVAGVPGSVDADIDAPLAWDLTRGDSNVIVAVIDSGANLTHGDLMENFLEQGNEDWDFADPEDRYPDDCGAHGTHVAGTAAGVENASGVIGVAPGCRIMPLRINLFSGMNANRADAINYVAAQAVAHADRRYVINCSWRASGNHAAIYSAILNAYASNVVVVFAAGNTSHGPVNYPARYPEAIAVASTNNRDQLSSFSAIGPEVDVSAPGSDIYSSVPNNSHAYMSGTSMASPHVAGLAALIWSRNPTLTNAQVRHIIETTCDDVSAINPAFVGQMGSGRINAFRALRATPLPPVRFQLMRTFAFPQANSGSSSGLAFARCMRFSGPSVIRSVLLFLTQQPYSEEIYFLSARTGAVIGSVDPVNNDTIGCLEWDGSYIRAANVTTGAGSINRISHTTGNQVGSIATPLGRGEGLAYDGTYLYYSTITRIHVINPGTGAVVRSFPPPGGSCRALAYGHGYLFSGNSSAGMITIFDPNSLVVRGTIAAPGGGSAQVEGLAFNPISNELFIANQSENNIYVGTVSL